MKPVLQGLRSGTSPPSSSFYSCCQTGWNEGEAMQLSRAGKTQGNLPSRWQAVLRPHVEAV